MCRADSSAHRGAARRAAEISIIGLSLCPSRVFKKKPNDLRDRPPAMFVGDEKPSEGPRVPEQVRETGTAAADGESSGRGCMFYFAVLLAIAGLYDELGLSEPMENVVLASAPVITIVLYLWNTLHDEDVARADRALKTPIAPLRRWLRRVLRIRPG